MIESMTGFGRGSAERDGLTAIVEMRSVNSRFCEVAVRLPRTLSDREPEVQSRIKHALSRGRVNVQVHLDMAPDDALPLRVDAEAAKSHAKLLESLRLAAGITEPLRLEHLLSFSESLFIPEETSATAEQQWAVAQAALEEAIANLQAMRLQEGRALHDDLIARIVAIEQQLEAVETRAPERVQEARRRLQERLQEWLADDRLDPERLEFEVVMLADKLDVTEECVRLRSHLQLFREGLEGDEAVGRKLNFLVQEINREVNTIGSKANDAEMAHRAVQMKEELEKIREQVQNIA
jgi:uncharacterized protein (TIGR00255 family)